MLSPTSFDPTVSETEASPGGAGTAESLIELAGIDDRMSVLDIGSGLGGSAFYLAEQKNRIVQGIDLVELNVAEANRRRVSDTSAEVSAGYRDVLKRLYGIKSEVCARFGQKVYDIVLFKQEFVLDAFTTGVLGAGSFVARKGKL